MQTIKGLTLVVSVFIWAFGQAQDRAKHSNQNEEIKSKRERNVKVFQTDEGGNEAIISQRSLHYKTSAGKWADVDPAIQPASDPSYAYENTTNTLKSFYPSVLTGEQGLRLIGLQGEMSIGLQPSLVWRNEAGVVQQIESAKGAGATYENNEVWYKDIFTKADNRYKVSADQVKNELILNQLSEQLQDRSGQLGFREKIQLDEGYQLVANGRPITGQQEVEGAIHIVNASQELAFKFPVPLVYELGTGQSNPDGGISTSYLIEKEGNTYWITTLVPLSWLTDPQRNYPIAIDPTVTIAGVTGGWQGSTGNYIDDDFYTFVGVCCGNGYHRAWSKFNTSSIPDNACITDVDIELYCNGVGCTNSETIYINDVTTFPGPYGAYFSTVYNDLGNGFYTSFVATTTGFYGYYDLGAAADNDLENNLSADWFQVGLQFANESSTCWKRFTSSSGSIRVTYENTPSTPGPISGPTSVCPGNSVTYSISSVAGATSYNWTVPAGWTINSGQGTTSINVTAGSSGGNICVTASNSCGTSSSRCISVSVKSNSTAPSSASASPSSICPGGTSTLSVSGGSLGTGADWNWYSGSCGGTFVGTGSSISVSPSSTTTYYVRAEGDCNNTSCVSTTVTVKTNSSAPSSASATPSSICPGGTSTLSVSGGSLGTGADWNWYSGSCGGTFVGTGSSIVVSPGATTTYFVRAEGDCNNTSCVSTTVTVKTNSSAPSDASASPSTICDDDSSTLSVVGGSLGTGADWNWYTGSCGGTFVGIGSSITVGPNTTTTYYVRAEGDCNVTSCANVTVNVNTTSSAPTSASATPTEICEGKSTILNVSGGSLGTGASWNWYSGSCGGTFVGTGSSITVSPTSLTTYFVRAEGTCDTTSCVNVTVTVFPKPNADFNAVSACEQDTVFFSDNSTISVGSITGWDWDFDDGNTSTQQNPSHVYANSGNYNVQLIVTSDEGCKDTILKNVTVHPKPQADFTYTKDCFDTTVYFTDLTTISSGSLVGWEWDFGDGDTAMQQNPTHDYDTFGYYQVRLIVTSDQGCKDTLDQQINVDSIEVLPPAVSDFSYTEACFGDSTQFNDLNSQFANSWDWDFGDGDTSDQEDPAHLYSSPGTYLVTLIISTNNGCTDTSQHNVPVHPNPQAGFTYTEACETSPTQFTDTSSVSSGTINVWDWDFGDGDSSNVQNPSHTYGSDGVYNTQLIVTSDEGCVDSVTQSVPVHPNPAVDFAATTVCESDTTFFSDSSTVSTGNITGWIWDFGDGDTAMQQNPAHVYASSGSYNVQLIVLTDNGCQDSLEKQVTVRPTPNVDFTFTAECEGNLTNFNDNTVTADSITSWQWDFGDGDTSMAKNPNHMYPDTGTYLVQLKVNIDNGCSDTAMHRVPVHPNPQAGFSYNEACFNSMTQFMDTSSVGSGNISGWKWSFGDGDTSMQQNPSHQYVTVDSFNVLLIVTTNNGCKDSAAQQVPVHPNPQAGFTAPAVCLGDTTNFSDTSQVTYGNITGWVWDFDDGDTSMQQNPGHKYDSSGTYSVTLVVTSDNGCQDTIQQTVSVNTVPNTDFVFDNACEDNFTNFTDSSTISVGNINGWLWNFGDGDTSMQQNPNHMYTDTGSYVVQLITQAGTGCVDSISKTVDIKPSPTADFGATTVCFGQPTTFTDSSQAAGSGGISGWNWNFGDSSTTTTQNPQHTYGMADTFNTQLVVTGANGCQGTVTKSVIVHPTPDALYGIVQNCALDSTLFRDFTSITNDSLVNWSWDFGDGNTSTQQNPKHKYDTTGTYTVSLIVTSSHGCVDTFTDQAPISVNYLASFTADSVCEGDSTHFTLNTDRAPYQVLWSFGDGDTAMTPNPTHLYDSAGSYVVELVVTNNINCRDTAYQTVIVHPNPAANATPDTTITKGESVQLHAEGGILFDWTPGATLDDSTAQEPMATPDSTTSYHLLVMDMNGCSATDTVLVQVEEETTFFIPNTITPNGDGINDKWRIQGLNLFKEIEVEIYNRWGNMVYQSDQYQNDWEGTSDGQSLPAATYYYILTFTDAEKEPITGTITIIR